MAIQILVPTSFSSVHGAYEICERDVTLLCNITRRILIVARFVTSYQFPIHIHSHPPTQPTPAVLCFSLGFACARVSCVCVCARDCARRKTFRSHHNFIACLFPFFAHLANWHIWFFFIWSHQMLDIKLIYCCRRKCATDEGGKREQEKEICFWYDIILCHSYWLLPWLVK